MKKYLVPVFILAVLAGCRKDGKNKTTYVVNSTVSKAEWTGSAPDHFHVGSFDVTGKLKVEKNGKVSEGDFVIPIASIKDFDLPEPLKTELLDHLKSPDFFNMLLHPDAKFRITRVTPYSGSSEENKDMYVMTGDFSMTGQTHPLAFPAKITVDADSVKASATFNLNRLTWGMTNYSNPAGTLYILPEVNIVLDIRAGRE